MKKRILSLLLAVLTLFMLGVPAFASENRNEFIDYMEPAGAIPSEYDAPLAAMAPASVDRPATTATSGSCGANLRWSFNSGDLAITGSGTMYGYANSNPPWTGLNVRRIIIDQNVASIGAWAFANLPNLSSFLVHKNSVLRSIGSMAFFNSGGLLSSFGVPGSVTSLADGALAGIGTESFVVGSGAASSYFTTTNGILYNKARTKLIQYPPIRSSTSYTMPSTVTAVAAYSMMVSLYLKSISLPTGLKTIGTNAFYGCNISSITIPSGVTSIGVGAFSDCQNLTRNNVQSDNCLIYNPSSASGAFFGEALGVPGKTVIYARTGSTAHTYATKNGYTFQSTGSSGGTVNPSTKNGLYNEGGNTYYYKNGVKQKGLVTVSKGVMYYCSSTDGHVYKNCWILINGVKKYAAQANGKLYTGYCAIDGQNYYFSVNDGHLMKGGLVTGPGGKQYYVSAKDGHAMKGGWAQGPNHMWYYLDKTGVVIAKVQSWTKPNYKPV